MEGLIPETPPSHPVEGSPRDTQFTILKRQFKNSRNNLEQGPQSYGRWAQSGLPPAFVNRASGTWPCPFTYLLTTAAFITAQNSDCPETEKHCPSPARAALCSTVATRHMSI